MTSVRWAMAAALLLTFPAGYLFQRATHQAGIEALLAGSTVALTIWFVRSVRPGDLRAPRLAAIAALTLILVRQTMEIEIVLWAAFVELRSLDATIAVCGAVLVSALAAVVWTLIARWLSLDAVRDAAIAFAAVFLVQGVVYALHESAEARWLPWSEPIHTASEPYGPEGQYGQKVSFLLFVIPLLSVAVMPLRDRITRFWRARPRRAVAVSMLGAACLLVAGAASGPVARSFFESRPRRRRPTGWLRSRRSRTSSSATPA
jgi:high-affinity iron transporter